MKKLGLAIPLLTVLACAPGQAAAASVMGSDLLSFSILSNTYTSTGANSTVYGNVLAGDYGTSGANSNIYGNFQAVNVATVGANALVQGNLQSILAGNLGADATVTGNFQAGLVGTAGANSVVNGSFVSGLAGTVGAKATVNGNFITGMVGTTGAKSRIDGNFDVGTGYARSVGAGSIIGGSQGTTSAADLAATAAMQSAISSSLATATAQLNNAKTTLSALGSGTGLAATMPTSTTFNAGVYSAASWTTTASTTLYLDGQNKDNQTWVFNITDILSTGASSHIELINAGANAQVFWNTGGYASLGASSTFLGTILATDYISVGASAVLKNLGASACGGLFSSTSYVSVGANAVIGSGGCSAVTSSITTPVPEPESYAMLLAGLGLVGTIVFRRAKQAA